MGNYCPKCGAAASGSGIDFTCEECGFEWIIRGG